MKWQRHQFWFQRNREACRLCIVQSMPCSPRGNPLLPTLSLIRSRLAWRNPSFAITACASAILPSRSWWVSAIWLSWPMPIPPASMPCSSALLPSWSWMQCLRLLSVRMLPAQFRKPILHAEWCTPHMKINACHATIPMGCLACMTAARFPIPKKRLLKLPRKSRIRAFAFRSVKKASVFITATDFSAISIHSGCIRISRSMMMLPTRFTWE